jgi:hypothetical protein
MDPLYDTCSCLRLQCPTRAFLRILRTSSLYLSLGQPLSTISMCAHVHDIRYATDNSEPNCGIIMTMIAGMVRLYELANFYGQPLSENITHLFPKESAALSCAYKVKRFVACCRCGEGEYQLRICSP